MSKEASLPVIRLATAEDADGILEIYRPVVERTPISFETRCPTAEEMARRIAEVRRSFPWFVLEDGGAILGYAYASPHKDRAAYRWSVDVAVYVREDQRRKGVAGALYEALLPSLRMMGIHNAVAVIALPNPASVSLHESLGFSLVGVYPNIGFKLGEWHDVGHWLLRLREAEAGPGDPVRPDQLERSGEWKAALSAAVAGVRP